MHDTECNCRGTDGQIYMPVGLTPPETSGHRHRRLRLILAAAAATGGLALVVVAAAGHTPAARGPQRAVAFRAGAVIEKDEKDTDDEDGWAPHFLKVSWGTCADMHMEPIHDADTCVKAARYLKLAHSLSGRSGDPGRPEGCYLYKDQKLIMGTNRKNEGLGTNVSDDGKTREQICVEPPARGKCSHEGENCLLTRCCMHPLKKCYQKNPHWATCTPNCTKGSHKGDPEGYRTEWNCKRMGRPSLFPDNMSKPSLHCFGLIQASGYEVDLSKELFKRGLNIFACDSWTMYSGGHVDLGTRDGVAAKTRVIPGDITTKVGGIYMTLLNTEVFIKVWKAVFEDGKIWDSDWTMKADADTVFLPGRIRSRLVKSNPFEAIYYNNCKYGNHGPLEVISKAGMGAFSVGMDICEMRFRDEFPLYGEDVFVRHCLRSLAVRQVDDFALLSEDHCDENPSPCVSGKAAFHPFKNWTSYRQCLKEAGAEVTPKEPRVTI